MATRTRGRWVPIKPKPARERWTPAPLPRHTPTVTALGVVSIVSDDPPLRVTCLMGEDPPTISGGYGGWQEKERPQRLPLTTWDGQPLYRLTVSLMLDGHAAGRSVESEIHTLERMGRDPGGDAQPPVVNVELPAGAPRSPRVAWVVENIEWGDALRSDSGERTRQQATVAFMQFVEDEHLKNLSPARKRKNKRVRTYTVKRGDTLNKIAKYLRGEPRWNRPGVVAELKKLNDIRDPNQVLRAGRRIRIP